MSAIGDAGVDSSARTAAGLDRPGSTSVDNRSRTEAGALRKRSSVSVIIPSYNYAHYLPGCVDSVLSQPGVEVEVLIIDDCSSDDTPLVGQRLAGDPRVTFRRHPVNQGHIATYNEGLEWASADYVAVLSADDLLVPGSLARAVGALDACPSAGFVYGRPVYFETNEAIPVARTGNPIPTNGPVATGSPNAAAPRPVASLRQKSSSEPLCNGSWAGTGPTCHTPATSRCGCGSPLMPTSSISVAWIRRTTDDTPTA